MPTPTSTDAAQPAVEFTDVTLAFDDGAGVFDVSFAIPKQSITVLTGPSVCGISTVLRLILGLHEPDTGDVRVLGQYPADFTLKDRGHIAYVPQEFALYPRLTVLENIRFASSVYGLGPFRRKDRITKALEMVQLNDVRHRKADDLSGGMRRRLQLAAALIHDGGLLIADEPTAGVDPILRVRIWEHLQQLRDDGHTIIVTTQYINEAEYGDRVFVMRAGYLHTAGSREEIRIDALG
ncbi:MAG: ABC transporter ATP-binding protein, partial [Anaerolineae bacterium]